MIIIIIMKATDNTKNEKMVIVVGYNTLENGNLGALIAQNMMLEVSRTNESRNIKSKPLWHENG